MIRELRTARDSVLAQLALLGADPALPTWDSPRLRELTSQIDLIIADLGTRMANSILLLPERASELGDRYSGGILQVKVTGSFGVLNRPALAQLQQYNLELVKKVSSELRQEIRSAVMQGIIQGEGIPAITRRLTTGTALTKGTFPKVEQRARVIARTETNRAFNQGVLWQFRQVGVRFVQWMTARDERVCEWCGPLDGLIFPIDRVPGGGPPLHPSDRCFMRAVLAETPEQAKVLDLQAARNAKEQLKRLAERKKKAVS